MTMIHMPVFHGIAPRIAPRKLSDSQAQTARDCDLFSGELRPMRDTVEVDTPSKTGTIQSIYRLDGLWLHWAGDVDVARSPLYLENEQRIHYSGDYNIKSTDNVLADTSPGTDYPTDYYRLGLCRPDNAPTVGSTGGSLNSIDRSYVYTFVTAWGEEGPPSPAGSHNGFSDATSWDLTAIDTNPPNSQLAAAISSIVFSGATVTVTMNASNNHFYETGEYTVISGAVGTGTLPDLINATHQITRVDELTFTFVLDTTPTGTYTGSATITREAPYQLTDWTKRVYRTLGGDFRYVGETTGTTYTDTTADADLGEVLPGGLDERQWNKAPNGNARGLVSFPGGILACFFGNTVALSEPGIPSAWPTRNQYTFNHPVVGLGVVGNSIVVATEGFPSVMVGDTPSAMVSSELEIFQSCVSKRGIASTFNGVLYPSPDGIVYVPAAGLPIIITNKFFKRSDWQNLNPSSFVAGVHDDRYYAFYTDGGESGGESGGIIFDLKEPDITFTQISIPASGVFSDLEEDELYFLRDGDIVKWDAGGHYLTYTWLSKIFTTARPLSFTCAKIRTTTGDGISEADILAAKVAAIAALEASLAATAMASSQGAANNYDSGAIAGSAAGTYTVAGGPYAKAVSGMGSAIAAIFRVYAWYDNGTGTTGRHLVHEGQIFGDSKPFRIGNIVKGFLADQWEVELSCNDVRVHAVMLGTSMRELARQ